MRKFLFSEPTTTTTEFGTTGTTPHVPTSLEPSITTATGVGHIDDDWTITDKPCESRTFDDAETICNTKYVGLRIPICAFANENTNQAYLGFVENGVPDDACSGERKGDWQFFNALVGCNTIKTMNTTHITYSNNVGGEII